MIKGNIAIIAGRGILPQLLIKELQKQDLKFTIFLLKSEQYENSYQEFNPISFEYGEVEKLLDNMSKHDIKNIVFAGAVNKPNFSQLKFDKTGRKLLGKILANKILGDDAVLRTVINFFEKRNIKILTIDQIIDCQIKQKGVLTLNKPNKDDLENIKIGTKAIKKFSKFDVGQSVIVAQKQIIMVEGVAGTDAMIKELARLDSSYKNSAVLVKLKKTNQSRKADLPAIGLQTIENCHKSQIKGIAIEAKSTLILQKKELIKKADDLGIFIIVI
jgi:DUF1009 family protein